MRGDKGACGGRCWVYGFAGRPCRRLHPNVAAGETRWGCVQLAARWAVSAPPGKSMCQRQDQGDRLAAHLATPLTPAQGDVLCLSADHESVYAGSADCAISRLEWRGIDGQGHGPTASDTPAATVGSEDGDGLLASSELLEGAHDAEVHALVLHGPDWLLSASAGEPTFPAARVKVKGVSSRVA